MSITDELREWASVEVPYKYGHQLNAIADRIDAEHERQLEVLYRDMSDAEWVRLPVDATGEPIHVGDVMESKCSVLLFGEVSFEVRAMRYDEGGWEVYNRFGDRYAPLLLRHYHAPTVEDVLREFVAEFNRDDTELCDEEIIERFAAKLRLADDKEEQ